MKGAHCAIYWLFWCTSFTLYQKCCYTAYKLMLCFFFSNSADIGFKKIYHNTPKMIGKLKCPTNVKNEGFSLCMYIIFLILRLYKSSQSIRHQCSNIIRREKLMYHVFKVKSMCSSLKKNLLQLFIKHKSNRLYWSVRKVYFTN